MPAYRLDEIEDACTRNVVQQMILKIVHALHTYQMILKTHIHDAMYSTHSIDNTDGTESTDTMDSIYNTDSIDYTDSTDNTNSKGSIHRTDSKDSTCSTEYSGYIIQSIEHTVYTVLYGMYKVLTMYSDRYNVTGGEAPVDAQDV